jgi:hypothetical protein
MPEHILTAKIEIAAPPAVVRKKVSYITQTPILTHQADNLKFLQFDQLPKYHPNGFFKSINTVVPNAPLEVGTKLRVVIEISTMEPPIIVSTLLHLHLKHFHAL